MNNYNNNINILHRKYYWTLKLFLCYEIANTVGNFVCH